MASSVIPQMLCGLGVGSEPQLSDDDYQKYVNWCDGNDWPVVARVVFDLEARQLYRMSERQRRAYWYNFHSLPEGEEPPPFPGDLEKNVGGKGLKLVAACGERVVDTDDCVSPRFKAMPVAEVLSLPEPEYALNPIFPRKGVVAFYGAPGAGKTFVSMDLAEALARGVLWFGMRTACCPVTYVFLEGGYGARNRAKAMQIEKGELSENLYFMFDQFDITSYSDLRALAPTLPSGGVLFIDTLSQASPGKDENHPRDMGEMVSGAKYLQEQTGGLVVLIHHSGKDAAKGMLGHTKLRAAIDAAIEVGRDGPRRWWKTAKNKDGPDDIQFSFNLKAVELGHNDYGEPITSCVVVRDDSGAEIRRAYVPSGSNQKIAVRIIGAAMKAQKPMTVQYPEFVPHDSVALDLEAIIVEIGAALTCPRDKRNTRAREAVAALVSNGYYRCKEGWLWK